MLALKFDMEKASPMAARTKRSARGSTISSEKIGSRLNSMNTRTFWPSGSNS
jgi:hypothetical protein